jgi:hypothetical protein
VTAAAASANTVPTIEALHVHVFSRAWHVGANHPRTDVYEVCSINVAFYHSPADIISRDYCNSQLFSLAKKALEHGTAGH